MTQQTRSQSKTPARPRFEKVALSLADLCGEEYIQTLCANRSCLTGQDPRELAQIPQTTMP